MDAGAKSMLPRQAAWLQTVIAEWSARAAERRRSGTAPDLAIAGALERIVAGCEAELAALPPVPAEDVSSDASRDVTWSSPVFHAGGRFNPFAGTYAEQMLASADACERLGAPAAAVAYRAHAARGAPPGPEIADPLVPAQTHPSRRSRPSWSGPNITPPEPAAFVAGPQLGLFA